MSNSLFLSFHNVVNHVSQIQALKNAEKSNSIALAGVTEAFNVRLRTSVDVLNTLSEFIRTQREHAIARYNYILESLKLKEAAGILTYKDIECINCWLVENDQD